MQKFVFIHIPKTAGVSIYTALLPYLTNMQKQIHVERVKAIDDRSIFYGHYGTKALVEAGRIEAGYFDDAFMFCFIRDPETRAWSLYRHSGCKDSGKTFIQFLEFMRDHKRDPVGFYTSQNYSTCNSQMSWLAGIENIHCLPYEKVAESFDWLCDKLELPEKPILPMRDHKPKIPVGLYDNYAQVHDLVREIWPDDFQIFHKFREQ